MRGGDAAEISIVEVDGSDAVPPARTAPRHRRRSWRPTFAVLTILTVLICAVVVLRSGTPKVRPPLPTPGHTSPRQVAPPPGGYVLPSRDVYPLAQGGRHS